MSPRRTLATIRKATIGVAFFFILGFAFVAHAETWRVRVEAVLDGDTLIVDGGERIRLRGIDAPEIRHGDEPGQYYGQAARKLLETLARGKDVLLDRSELDTDRYGRKVGVIRLADGRMLNALMVEDGAAFVYPHSSDDDRALEEQLLIRQRQAMQQQRGFWGRISILPQAQNRYVGTRSSKRFHALTCSHGVSISPKNRIDFSSLSEAFRAGFAPARDCTVWPHGD